MLLRVKFSSTVITISTLAFRKQQWSCGGSIQNIRSYDFEQIVLFKLSVFIGFEQGSSP